MYIESSYEYIYPFIATEFGVEKKASDFAVGPAFELVSWTRSLEEVNNEIKIIKFKYQAVILIVI